MTSVLQHIQDLWTEHAPPLHSFHVFFLIISYKPLFLISSITVVLCHALFFLPFISLFITFYLSTCSKQFVSIFLIHFFFSETVLFLMTTVCLYSTFSPRSHFKAFQIIHLPRSNGPCLCYLQCYTLATI